MNISDRRNLLICGLTLTAAIMLAAIFGLMRPSAGGYDPANPQTSLADIEDTVSRNYPVAEITNKMLGPSLSDPNTLVFDVRAPNEYIQSHLAGAHRIDPGMSAKDFIARFGPELKGKLVVFYCAVGVRSGGMLTRLEPALATSGVKAAANLRGGIFRWFADGGPVVTESGRANSVHSFDDAWGALLERTLKKSPRPARS